MPQPPEPPVKHRLRLVRRRIMAAVLATFVAAWLAVAALGKGGASSTAAASGSPATGASTQSDEGAGPAQNSEGGQDDGFGPSQSGEDPDADGFGAPQSDGGPSADSGSNQSGGRQGGPVTTGQS